MDTLKGMLYGLIGVIVVACGGGDSTLSRCTKQCETLAACVGGVGNLGYGTIDACAEDCAEGTALAEKDPGPDCGKSVRALDACLATIDTCNQWLDYLEGNSPYVCEAEDDAVYVSCVNFKNDPASKPVILLSVEAP